MYRYISSNQNNNTFRWAFNWTLKVPPKIKTFMWKLCNKLIPTKHFLCRRIHNDSLDTTCSICNVSEETIMHLFKDYSSATNCWKFLDKWWVAISLLFSVEDWLWKLINIANKTAYSEH